MKVVLIGAGCGTGEATLTGEARKALSEARLVLGPRRLLASLPDHLLPQGCRKEEATYPEAILSCLKTFYRGDQEGQEGFGVPDADASGGHCVNGLDGVDGVNGVDSEHQAMEGRPHDRSFDALGVIEDLGAVEDLEGSVRSENLGNIGEREVPGDPGNAVVLFSGDSGFFSGVRKLLPCLEYPALEKCPTKEGSGIGGTGGSGSSGDPGDSGGFGGSPWEVVVLPGISSVQLLAARLRRPWQDWGLHSAHGVDCDILQAVCEGRPAFFLTGGKLDPAEICLRLSEAGLGELEVTIGENLGCAEEKIRCGRAWDFAAHDFPPLSVLLAEAAPRRTRQVPGIPDGDFIRKEGIPMTKQETRAVLCAKLALSPGDICWDIGTGTGSVAIELALQARAVYSVEYRSDALEIAQENRKHFGAWNLHLVEGRAPEALGDLPAPDAVFIGGSEGRIREILQKAYAANPAAKICISAITLEGLHGAYTGLEELGYEAEVSQVSVSRGRALGGYHLMLAQNTVYLISGKR